MSQLSVLTRGMLYPAANALLSPLSPLQGGR